MTYAQTYSQTQSRVRSRSSQWWIAMAAVAVLAIAPLTARGEVQTSDVDYAHGDVALQGYLARDTAREDYRGAVMVVHEWWGLNDYAKRRTRQLAELGYIAFAVDMYGKGKVTDDPAQSSQWSGEIGGDRELLRARAQAGLDAFREEADLGDMQVAAIGYCFGGTTVMELAWSGADLAGVVSFHGGPKPPMEGDKERIQASVLICHGAADPAVSDEQLDNVTTALEDAGADWMLISYAKAKHAFTNPASAERESDTVNYVEAADRRSWQHMKLFFDEIFGNAQQAQAETEEFKIAVNADGHIYPGPNRMLLKDIRIKLDEMAKKNPDRRIVIDASQFAEYGKVMELVDAAQKAGFTNVSFQALDRDGRE